jgi:glycine/D-amino acid oxidase-like deaminating enzyme
VRGSGRPVWDDETSPGDVRELERRDEPPRTCDVLVVGGGIIGLAIAASCSQRGMSVVVVERGRLAGGASGRAAGGLACDAHPQAGPEWHRYAFRSLELHRAQDDYAVEDLDLRVVPNLVVPAQARVNPLEMAAALSRRVGVVCTNTEDSGAISSAAIVYATGAARATTLVKGHLIATAPASFTLGEIVATADSEFLALQLPSGRIVAGGTKEPDDTDDDVRDETVERIRRQLVEIAPPAKDVEVTHAWTCFRPKMGDELPVIDRIGEREFVATGFYSTGILMAPVAGELVAGAIQGEMLPQAFSAKRFR